MLVSGAPGAGQKPGAMSYTRKRLSLWFQALSRRRCRLGFQRFNVHCLTEVVLGDVNVLVVEINDLVVWAQVEIESTK
jgi:hypothetical protein